MDQVLATNRNMVETLHSRCRKKGKFAGENRPVGSSIMFHVQVQRSTAQCMVLCRKDPSLDMELFSCGIKHIGNCDIVTVKTQASQDSHSIISSESSSRLQYYFTTASVVALFQESP